ncbi:MAG TPA: 23S rRNA (pseudouridine(1915)-N(3))-methyltransferase RlmH [Burkholderiales bacterium]|nr:23S rRNA (pseudouridine(1915)-N(3))-methyltransferase RlmH [Burkholderiales bacterium]
MASLLVVAVGTKPPGWAQAACAEYLKRMPRRFATELVTVKAEPRASGKPAAQLLAAEGARLRRRMPPGARVVALDERGREFDSAAFAAQLERWLGAAQPVAFVIGGADGLDPALKRDASLLLRVSAFTLPHALAQVVLCEQLYRAASLLEGHPYHRA